MRNFGQVSKATLSSEEKRTIDRALRIATEKFDEDAKVFRTIAKAIRSGKGHPMFAPGEAGAEAADRLAEDFERSATDTCAVNDRIETFDEIVLVAHVEEERV